jgi:hypothetical protein
MRTFSITFNSNHATSGDTSNMPMRGMIR